MTDAIEFFDYDRGDKMPRIPGDNYSEGGIYDYDRPKRPPKDDPPVTEGVTETRRCPNCGRTLVVRRDTGRDLFYDKDGLHSCRK